MPIIRRTFNPAIGGALAASTGAAQGAALVERQQAERGERELERARALQQQVDSELLRQAVTGSGGSIDARGIIEHNLREEARKNSQRASRRAGLASLRRTTADTDAITEYQPSTRRRSDDAGVGSRLRSLQGRDSSGLDDYKDLADIERTVVETAARRRKSLDDSAAASFELEEQVAGAPYRLQKLASDAERSITDGAGAYLDLDRKAALLQRENDEADSRYAATQALRQHAMQAQIPPAVVTAAASEMLSTGRFSASTMRALGFAPDDDTTAGGIRVSVGARDFLRVIEGGGYAQVLEASGATQPNEGVAPSFGPDGKPIIPTSPTGEANRAAAAWAEALPRMSAKQIQAVIASPGFDRASESVRTMVKSHYQAAKRAEVQALAPADFKLLGDTLRAEIARIGKGQPLDAKGNIDALAAAMQTLQRTAPEVMERIDAMEQDPEMRGLLDEFLRTLGVGVSTTIEYPDSPE